MLAAAETTIIVTLSGIDETVAQTIYARHIYAAHEILWNMRFADILLVMPDGQRHVDYSRFHDVVPLELGKNQAGRI
jgi:inward rectifier potassium channel